MTRSSHTRSVQVATCIGAIAALTLTNTAVAQAAPAQPEVSISERSSLDDATLVLAESLAAARALDEIGLSEGDFYADAEIDQAWVQDAMNFAFANAGIDKGDAAPISLAAARCDDAAQIVYADHIASINENRDKNARTHAQETAYMWLSHYVDMSPSQLPATCSYDSDKRYYSAWITDTDRRTYDQFLNTLKIVDTGTAIVHIATSAATLAATPGGIASAVAETSKVRTAAHGISLVVDAGWSGYGLKQAGERLVMSYQAGMSPEAAILKIRKELEAEDLGLAGSGYAAAIVAAGFSATGFGAVIGIGAATVSMYATFGNDLVSTAAWAGMVYSTSGRITGRLLRSVGM